MLELTLDTIVILCVLLLMTILIYLTRSRIELILTIKKEDQFQ